jgi:hypothetical protein
MESTMRMPGFTAGGSLYRAAGRYRNSGLYDASMSEAGVSPQLPKSIGFCMDGCDDQYEWGSLENSQCKFDCMDDGGGGDGGGGGGGGGGGPKEVCGKCITVGPLRGKKRCTIPGKGSFYDEC